MHDVMYEVVCSLHIGCRNNGKHHNLFQFTLLDYKKLVSLLKFKI